MICVYICYQVCMVCWYRSRPFGFSQSANCNTCRSKMDVLMFRESWVGKHVVPTPHTIWEGLRCLYVDMYLYVDKLKNHDSIPQRPYDSFNPTASPSLWPMYVQIIDTIENIIMYHLYIYICYLVYRTAKRVQFLSYDSYANLIPSFRFCLGRKNK